MAIWTQYVTWHINNEHNNGMEPGLRQIQQTHTISAWEVHCTRPPSTLPLNQEKINAII
jgi:hypothetical protein